MIVRLTNGQLAACVSVAAGWPELINDLDRGSVRRAPGTVDVQMPYIAWVALRERLMDRVFNSRGFQQKGVPTRFANALKRVAAGCNWWARLPPLKGAGMLGWQPLIIPAWSPSAHFGNGSWRPYPIHLVPMRLLVPGFIEQNGTRLTRWSPEDVVPTYDHWSLGEEAFRPYVGVARRELDLATLVDGGGVQAGDVHADS